MTLEIKFKTMIPKHGNYLVPNFKNNNDLPDSCCKDCISEFDDVGISFMNMLKSNLISELPFDVETNAVILNCTECMMNQPLKVVSKAEFTKLRQRGGDAEIKFLVCKHCNLKFM